MQTGLWIGLVLCAFGAAGLVWLQYFFKSEKSRLHFVLAILRFLSLFFLLLLLWNPEYIRTESYPEKFNLVVLNDNSASIAAPSDQDFVRDLSSEFSANSELKDRFDYYSFAFDIGLSSSDSLNFERQGTDIWEALEQVSTLYEPSETLVVIATDGNQTQGRDYQFPGADFPPVLPVVLGDTTRYADLSIDQLNLNKYAFLDNRYPVEAFISYTGEEEVSTSIAIYDNGKPVYRQSHTFSPDRPGYRLEQVLEAAPVGIHDIEIRVTPLEDERNVINNQKTSVIEVVDETTKVGIVRSVLHPDIGALSRSITANQQREVDIFDPTDDIPYDQLDILILYQPTSAFRDVYQRNAVLKIPVFTITGPQSDWNLINEMQTKFEKEVLGQSEEVFGFYNAGFTVFDIDDFDIQGFPPLNAQLGNYIGSALEAPLFMERIKGVPTGSPLFTFYPDETHPEVLLMGENIWKWRMAHYRKSGSHKSFDNFMGKVMRFLALGDKQNRLSLDYSSEYERNQKAQIRARFFDQSLEFEPNAKITLELNATDGPFNREVPMLLQSDYYEANIDFLDAGTYDFMVRVNDNELQKSGRFVMKDTKVEAYQVSSDYKRLQQLADVTGGALFFPDRQQAMIDSLRLDPRWRPIQKTRENVVSLIDFKWLLGLIVIALSAEWFIRKYHGLI